MVANKSSYFAYLYVYVYRFLPVDQVSFPHKTYFIVYSWQNKRVVKLDENQINGLIRTDIKNKLQYSNRTRIGLT